MIKHYRNSGFTFKFSRLLSFNVQYKVEECEICLEDNGHIKKALIQNTAKGSCMESIERYICNNCIYILEQIIKI